MFSKYRHGDDANLSIWRGGEAGDAGEKVHGDFLRIQLLQSSKKPLDSCLPSSSSAKPSVRLSRERDYIFLRSKRQIGVENRWARGH